MRVHVCTCALVLFLAPITAHAGSLELGTYYPAPFGSYDRLRLVPRAALSGACDPGSIYVENTNTTLQFCNGSNAWEPLARGYWVQAGSSLYPVSSIANVGIGITAPETTLDVAKDVAPFSGITNVLSLRAYDTDGAANSANGDGGAINFKSRSNNTVVDIGRISGILTQTGNPTYSALAFSSYADVGGTNALTETMRIVNNKVGIGTTNPEFRLTLDKGAATPDGGILAIGTFGSGNTLATSGAGTRLIWYPKRAAFRVGYVSGSKWDEPNNIGNYSIAMGYDPQATADGSIALGNGASATNIHAVAIGKDAQASGVESIAIGKSAVASGDTAVAFGNSTTSSSNDTLAMGNSTTASGHHATAMGHYTTAQAQNSVVMGRYNITSGDKYNWISTDPLFVIGNGNGIIGDPDQYRNALTVLKNGNVGIGTTDPGTNRLEVTGGLIQAAGGLIIETRTTNNPSGVNGQFWVCTDTGNATPCDGI